MLDLQRGQKISIQTVCRTWTLEVELRHQGQTVRKPQTAGGVCKQFPDASIVPVNPCDVF